MSKKAAGWLRPSFVFLLLSAIFLAFQNCSGRPWTSSQFADSRLKQSGNGGGYEGKLSYYRFVPDLICEGQKTYKEMLLFDQDQIWLHENISDQKSCTKTVREIPLEDIHYSPFQREFLDVRDVLYASYDLKLTNTPDLLAESLCRDDWAKPSFELINHYNYRTGQATTRIYYITPDGPAVQLTDNTTQRVLAPQNVKLQAFDERLKYHIDLSQGHGPYSRRYLGEISYVKDGLAGPLQAKTIECITGGGLDSSIWPLKKVDISPTISNFLVHPTENDIYFSDRDPVKVNWWRPFVLKESSQLIDISASIFKTPMYVSKNTPIRDSKWMTLEGLPTDGTPYFGRNLYIYNSDTSATPITLVKNARRSPFTQLEENVVSPILQLSDSEFGFWIERKIYQSVNQPAVDSVHYYRILNWQTQGTKDFLYGHMAKSFTQSLYFDPNPWPNGVIGSILPRPDGRFEIQYMDIIMRIPQSLLLPKIDQCAPRPPTRPEDGYRFFISQKSLSATIEFICENMTAKVLTISLESGAYYFSGANDTILWASRDGEFYMLGEVAESLTNVGAAYFNYNPQKIKFVVVRSGLSQTTKIDPHLISSIDQLQFEERNKIYYEGGSFSRPELLMFSRGHLDYLVGFSAGSSWTLRLRNLATNNESTVCTNAVGTKLKMVKFTDDQVAVVTFLGNRVFVYEISESQSCKLLNSAFSKMGAIRFMVPTKNGLGLALNLSPGYWSFTEHMNPDDVYFLNKDGRAPLHINLDNEAFRRIVDMQVSFDHSRLYILGTGMNYSIYQTLFWLKL